MIFARVLISILIFSAGLAQAEQARVRSGDHGDFTRLVIDLPRVSEWSLTQDGRDVRVQIAQGVTGFDVGSVFDRIDRSTIANVASQGTRLAVQLGCDCDVSSYLSGDKMLVLDARPKTKQDRLAREELLFSWVRPRTTALSFGTSVGPKNRR